METFTFKPETRDDAIARYKQTGGRPPNGATLLGRWIAADFSVVFVLVESDDVKALTEYALMWSDLMTVRIVPVADDTELGEVLERMAK